MKLLRVFKLNDDLVSTFEQGPISDLSSVKAIDVAKVKYGTLFPKLLQCPSPGSPTPREPRPASSPAAYGFPICWSVAGLVWLPYLPAVVTYLHPIFGSMNLRPDVVPVEHGFVLDPLTVIQWENVESAIQVVTEGLLSIASTAQHPPPFFPSSYGYRDTFPTRKRAKNAIKPSVLAFHHVLAYCSYLVASLDFPRERLESFYEDLTNAPPTLQNIMTNNGSGVVLKLLWSTLGEMHRARNFSGIVVSYNRPYNYKSIQRMQGYGVPVFVQWSCSARSQSYREFPQAEILDKWCPSPDSFAILCPGQSFTRSVSHAPSAQHPIPLPPPVPTPIESHGRCPWSHRCTLGLSHTSLSEDTVHAASGSAADENEAGFPVEESRSNTAIRSGLLHSSRVSSLELMGLWRDVGEFLYVRYGVSYISEVVDPRKDAKWSAVLGICCSPAASLVDLYNCVTRGRWPYGSCDLSLDLARANLLPGPSADYPIHSTPLPGSQGYLISVAEAWGVSWKLIVRDPLTVLQIEREGWVCPDGLIGGMIRKGVPFRILNPVKLEGEEVCGNRGPVVYTDGNEPERVAYLVYREQLRRFFTDNPHAYSAALSAGGILWRIAMDVLPALNAEAVVRPFHPGRCTLSTIDGKEYWTPWLTPLEKDVVVGVQRGLTSSDGSRREHSLWPKPQTWNQSGLEFGAWAPINEEWYASRAFELEVGVAGHVQVREWRSKIRYKKKEARKFISYARRLTNNFLCDHRC